MQPVLEVLGRPEAEPPAVVELDALDIAAAARDAASGWTPRSMPPTWTR